MATVPRPLSLGDAIPHATLQPTRMKADGTNFPLWGLAFAGAAANQQVSWRFKASKYGSGNVTVVLDWYSVAGSTTGSVTWGGCMAVVTPGDAQSMESDALQTEQTQATTVNGTAKGLTRTSLVLSNLDSLAADDSVELRLRRTDSSMTGQALLIGVEIQYSDT
jgi:hypothetical protein